MRSASLWLTLCISYGALAAPFGINPSKIKQKPFYLYKGSTVDLKNNTVGVDGFSYKKEGRTIYIDPTGSKSTLSLEDFLFYRRLGASSFQTITGTGTGAGSSFLVGENLVLTNKHVAATDNKKKACGKFAIEFGPEKILCKKVWYCDSHDFCLVEMNPTKDGKNLSEVVQPLALSTKKATGSTIYLIGNSHDLGVQGSEGYSFRYIDRVKELGTKLAYEIYPNSIHDMNFHAPSLGGSSGSPIFDRAGAVVGINYAHSSPTRATIGNDVQNHAVPAYYMISQLKKNLPADIFKKIKIDQNNLAQQDKFVADWKKAFAQSAQTDMLHFDDFLACLEDRQPQRCLDQIDELFSPQALQKRYSHLSQMEISHLPTPSNVFRPALLEYEKTLKNPSVDFLTTDEATKKCAELKQFDQNCFIDQVTRISLRKLPYFSKLLTLYKNEDVSRVFELSQDLFKTEQSRFYFALSDAIKKDKQVIPNAFAQCLAGVEKIYIKDKLFEGFSTPIHSDGCRKQVVEGLRQSGYRIGKEVESDATNVIIADQTFGTLVGSFQTEVLEEWKVFANAPFKKKELRGHHNTELIEAWARKNHINVDAVELHQAIAQKMKYFYL